MENNFDDEVLQMYIEESREHLAGIEADLLAMEERGADIDEERVNEVFRAAHSLKGGAGFFGLVTIKELSHKIENVLSMIRSRELVPNPEVVNILLLAFDKLRELLGNTGDANNVDVSEFIVSLTGLTAANLPAEKKESVRTSLEVKLADGRTIMSILQFDVDRHCKEGKNIYLIEYDLMHDVHRVGKTPLDLVRQITEGAMLVDCVIDIGSVGTLEDPPARKVPFFVVVAAASEDIVLGMPISTDKERMSLLYTGNASPAGNGKTEAAASGPAPAPEPASVTAEKAENRPVPETHEKVAVSPEKTTAQAPQGGQTETSLRVNVAVLENLMNLAGELVLSRNQLVEAISRNDQRALKASGQRISLVTSELQETIMLTRMQPVGNVFNKFQRVIRDLSRNLGKQVRLDIIGSDVEMDKTIIEGLSDPLTHLVRNAVDHGVETPEVRSKAGKSLPGVVTLKAYHEAGQVNVEISDDGKGIDAEKIAASAVRKGLVTAEQVRTMSDKEMMSLVFMPGLSTAEVVTDVSGRGVGMDVVKTNLDKLGGIIDITSDPGRGSTFRIKLPLTLAIIPCLLVSTRRERFAIPQANVKELIRIPAAQIKEKIELVGSAEVLPLRGTLIPVVHLSDVLGIPSAREKETSEKQQGDLNVIIVTTGVVDYGLVVEELHDSVEIVVKPMGRHLKRLKGYVGATIMGNGRVALILDIAGLAQLASINALSNGARTVELALEADRSRFEERHSFLTFWGGATEQCAVPLDLVARIEQIEASQVEIVGGERVMQYRDRVMPLITLKDVTNMTDVLQSETLVVVVFRINDKEVGLLGAAPVDVVETELVIDNTSVKQTGVVGTSIVKEQTVLLVDIHEVVESLYPEWGVPRRKDLLVEAERPTVLLAEDSQFFREQVKRFIEADGYHVVAGEDGLAAWNLLEENAGDVGIVVTDIEMPRLDGYGLARRIKGDDRFSGLPIIALSSLASEDDITKGKAAGIDNYQIKLDKDSLLGAISGILHERRDQRTEG